MLPSVEYLGFRISAAGLQPTNEKVRAIQNTPAPEEVSQLKSFLGLVNYYGKLLPDLSPVQPAAERDEMDLGRAAEEGIR